jgi:hypothetical protein
MSISPLHVCLEPATATVTATATAPPSYPKDENVCIICLDTADLIKNTRCQCVYYYHADCITMLPSPDTCILCKTSFTNININKTYYNIMAGIFGTLLVIVLIGLISMLLFWIY